MAARTAITVETISGSGLAVGATNSQEVTAIPADGHKVFNGAGGVLILVRNSNANDPGALTIVTGKTVSGLAVSSRTVTIPKSESRIIALDPPDVVNQHGGADNGYIYINADIADLKIQALAMPRWA